MPKYAELQQVLKAVFIYNMKKIVKFTLLTEKKTSRIVLRDFMENHAGTKNMCKKTSQTRAEQSFMGF